MSLFRNSIAMFPALYIVYSTVLSLSRYVMLGNHRDAWGFGAVDPSSGTAQLMEVVRQVLISIGAELGTRQHCCDNVTMFLGHKIVGYCILCIFVH